MAYVFCAMLMSGFWWYKPFGAEHITVVTSATDSNFRVAWHSCPEEFMEILNLALLSGTPAVLK
jgi:hypothetical protein